MVEKRTKIFAEVAREFQAFWENTPAVVAGVERRSEVQLRDDPEGPIALMLVTIDGRFTDEWRLRLDVAKRIRDQLDHAIMAVQTLEETE